MKNQSLTITGIFIMVISFLSKRFELGFTEHDIATIVMDLAEVGGICLAYYGRVRKGDITLTGKRKNAE